ncbi:Ultraviolet-B receptor UVR8 [Diplonema papillatum]|nr:Ultraviolet-B receptor UVR8 [Diplonema papillatum]|eukprot:gene20867-32182_t
MDDDGGVEAEEDALRARLQNLQLVEQTFGENGGEAAAEKTAVADLCCSMALERLYSIPEGFTAETAYGQLSRAKSYLDAALVLLRPGTLPASVEVLRIRATAFANLACLYKKANRVRAALLSAQKATAIYRTLCAPHAALSGAPEEFPSHAKEQLVSSLLTESALLCASDKPREGLSVAVEGLTLCVGLETSSNTEVQFAQLQAMCHHNVGVCQEMLGKLSESLSSYRTAFQLMYLSAGAQHPLCVKFKDCFADAYAQAHSKAARSNVRTATTRQDPSLLNTGAFSTTGKHRKLAPVPTATSKRYNLNGRLPTPQPRKETPAYNVRRRPQSC